MRMLVRTAQFARQLRCEAGCSDLVLSLISYNYVLPFFSTPNLRGRLADPIRNTS